VSSRTDTAREAASWPFSPGDMHNCHIDSRSEPNNVHLEAWLPGRLSPRRLRAAVSGALADVPRTRVRRQDAAWWRAGYTWQAPPSADIDPVSVLDWRTAAELDSARAVFLSAPTALDQAPVFRLLLARGPARDCLILSAHHAAFDGRSCVSLLRLIASHYDGSARPGPGPLSAADLAGRPPAAGQASPEWVPAWPRPAWRAARIAPQRGGRPPADSPGFGCVLLAWPGIPAARQLDGDPRVTVNDLLIAALGQAVASWNAARGRPPRPVAVSMPIDTRQPWADGALGNLSRLSTITVDPREAALTAAVAGQTNRAKDRPGPLLGPALGAAEAAPLPAPVKRALVRLAMHAVGPVSCDTTLLSNLGQLADPPRFGDLVPDQIWFSASTHMPRGLSVGAISVGGRLQLCFRYRRALLDRAAAREFAAGYAAALAELTGARPPSGPADPLAEAGW